MFCVSLHLYLYLCPGRSPTFPRLQKPGCLCSGHPPLSPAPLPHPQLCLPAPHYLCVVLHGFAVMKRVETQQSLKLVPRRQAAQSKDRQAAGGTEEGGGENGPLVYRAAYR